MVEIDRRGNEQAVFYQCGNKEFEEFVLSFGFKKNYGTFSDISVLSPTYDIASVNVSAGYYNEHTVSEYIKIAHLKNSINKIKEMLKSEDERYFDYQEKEYTYCQNQTTLNDKPKETDKTNKVDKTDKTNKKGTYPDEEYLWEMFDDWYILSDKAWEMKYQFKKPPTADEVWDY
jgi:hypothetical protein